MTFFNHPFSRFLFFSLLRNSQQEEAQVRKQRFYAEFQLFSSFITGSIREEAVFFLTCWWIPASGDAIVVDLPPPRGEKETWIRSKYVEKKFIQKLPETGKNVLLLRRSSAVRNRAATAPKPPLKPKPNRATLPRMTGGAAVVGGGGAGDHVTCLH